MSARTYTPEAIAALVAEAQATAQRHPGEQRLRDALRPFTSWPSSWPAFCRELWGEGWTMSIGEAQRRLSRHVTGKDYEAALQTYRTRYGVEPL